jgi:RHH-type proline utilization regulon transcriptional repressor/proline dehydrogenase/delta 1-pyrroline-5-carboxylate dehydrogenase
MASTTLGVKVDDALRDRLKAAAQKLNCTPHWLHKQAILAYLDKIERGHLPAEMSHLGADAGGEDEAGDGQSAPTPPFYEFGQDVQPQSVLRAAITAAYRRPESECVPLLLGQARMPNLEKIHAMAAGLVKKLRGKRSGGGVEGLIQEFSLSSQEGVALMCLAEALLRIPDRATRDALIRDKVARGDWKSHMGGSQSLFVNAATWGLMITG